MSNEGLHSLSSRLDLVHSLGIGFSGAVMVQMLTLRSTECWLWLVPAALITVFILIEAYLYRWFDLYRIRVVILEEYIIPMLLDKGALSLDEPVNLDRRSRALSLNSENITLKQLLKHIARHEPLISWQEALIRVLPVQKSPYLALYAVNIVLAFRCIGLETRWPLCVLSLLILLLIASVVTLLGSRKR